MSPSVRPSLSFAVLLLIGCAPKGDPGDTGDTTTSATTSSTSGHSSTHDLTTGGTAPTSGGMTASGTTGTTGAPGTTAATDTSGAPDTTDGPVTTGVLTTTTEPGDTTTADTTTGDVDCSPPKSGDPCQTDADCEISGDCCGCVAFNPDFSSPGNCGGMCMQDKCEEWGLDGGACEDGVCVVKGKSCDQSKVTCDLVAPDCPMGQLPQVVGNCFTGECLPLPACDWVPDCGLCGPDQVCQITQEPNCTHQRCIPDIDECQGSPLCSCLGQIFCEPPHETCEDIDGNLVCSL